jgi:hypothetical protein
LVVCGPEAGCHASKQRMCTPCWPHIHRPAAALTPAASSALPARRPHLFATTASVEPVLRKPSPAGLTKPYSREAESPRGVVRRPCSCQEGSCAHWWHACALVRTIQSRGLLPRRP